MIIPRPVQNLIEAFDKLPGIGPKTAARLTFYLLHVPEGEVLKLAEAVERLKKDTVICSVCFNVSEADPCPICRAPDRERELLAVVETPLDVLALERAGFKGLYHVLHGVIDPLNNIGPDELRIRELIRRVFPPSVSTKIDESAGGVGERFQRGIMEKEPQPGKNGTAFSEIILATNPSVEGETTAMYIKRELRARSAKRKTDIKITRLARGLPVGGDLEYADDVTLNRALEGRTEY